MASSRTAVRGIDRAVMSCGARPAAILGTFSYRFFALWLPQPLSFLMLPRLRRLLEVESDADEPTSPEEDVGAQTNEPALKR
jgi:hypothetical protein